MPTGRQTKLTPALQVAIVQAVSLGVPLITAGSYAGVSKAALLQWLQRGEGTHPTRPATKAYVDFVDAIEKARAQDEVRRIARLEKAARGGEVLSRKTLETVNNQGEVVKRITEERYTSPEWTADAWFLERSYPDRWGRKERLDMRVTIERAAALVADQFGLSTQEILEEARLLLQEVDRGEYTQ